jgi:hypothetical protein
MLQIEGMAGLQSRGMKHRGIAAHGPLGKVVREPGGELGVCVMQEVEKTCPLRRNRIRGWSLSRRYRLAVLGAEGSGTGLGDHRRWSRLFCTGTAKLQPRLVRIGKSVNVIAATGMGPHGPEKQHGGAGKDHLRQKPNHVCGVRPSHALVTNPKQPESTAYHHITQDQARCKRKKRVRIVNSVAAADSTAP